MMTPDQLRQAAKLIELIDQQAKQLRALIDESNDEDFEEISSYIDGYHSEAIQNAIELTE